MIGRENMANLLEDGIIELNILHDWTHPSDYILPF